MTPPKSVILAAFGLCTAHDRAEVLADESTGVIARGLGGVDDRGADREEVLQPLLYPFVLGNVSPSANEVQRMTSFVTDDPEAILDPDIVPIAVTEAILN